MPDVQTLVSTAILKHPSVREVRLAGARARGNASPLSDWDFEIDASDPQAVADSLPSLVQPLHPIAAQFDRLAYTTNYMLILHGPIKIDLLFPNLPWVKLPPWEVTRETLGAVDAHFWDWILWLASKSEKHQDETVAVQLELMDRHLLRPLGAIKTPESLDCAVRMYRQLRSGAERRFDVRVAREAQDAVTPALQAVGYDL